MELNEYADVTQAPVAEEVPPRFWGMARLMAELEPNIEVDRTDPSSVGGGMRDAMRLLQHIETRSNLAPIIGMPQAEEARQFTAVAIAGALTLALMCQYTMEIIARELHLEEE